MDYGRAVRIARAARGISQKQLAARTSLNASYVSLVEAGRRNPSPRTMERLARALKVPVHLMALLGADPDDLAALSPDHAARVGSDLLDLIAAHVDLE